MAKQPQARGSTLMLDEYFGIEDARFLDELRAIAEAPKLAAFAERWKKDPRPWARKQILAYLELPLCCNGHQALVKRLFKHAEAQRDHELLSAFMVAFDRLVRRVRHRYSWSNDDEQSVTLRSPRNVLLAPKRSILRRARNPRTGEEITIPVNWAYEYQRRGRLFSYHTRGYLRRRAWRYFRRLGHQHPNDYLAAVSSALRLYTDDDLRAGENILDSWSLLHICFAAHDALEFGSTHVRTKEGRALSELSAKPAFPELWSKPETLQVLLNLVLHARARLVRVWATQCLRAMHSERLKEITIDDIFKLLEHDDEEIQQFGAEIFNTYSGLDKLPLAKWLKLLQTRNLTALQIICDAFVKHVHADRLTLAQCVELACERPAAVAKLGLVCLKARKIATPDERRTVAAVASAQSVAVATELAEWALPIVGGDQVYGRDAVSGFFDSLLKETRAAAWQWLLKKESPAYDDAGLWARLLETPYEELRLSIVDLLAKRALPGTNAQQLESLWCSVLLAIHRGGPQKS